MTGPALCRPIFFADERTNHFPFMRSLYVVSLTTNKELHVNEKLEMGNAGRTVGLPDHVALGRIMSPAQVADAIAGRDAEETSRLEGHWSLCGDMSEGMFEHVLSHPQEKVFHGLATLEGHGGGKYLVMASQIGPYQHRFIVPLYEPIGRELLIELCFTPLALMLGRASQEDAIVWFPKVDYMQLRSFIKGIWPTTLDERASNSKNFLQSVRELCRLDGIPPMEGAMPVEHLSLTTVLPADFSADMYRVLEEVSRMQPVVEGNKVQLH